MTKSTFSFPTRLIIKFRQSRFANSNSYPFLSGEAFKSICDIAINNESDLDVFAKQDNGCQLIFCCSELALEITKLRIESTPGRTLIMGNSDFEFTNLNQIPQHGFERFYLQNSLISNERNIFTLPIGVENLSIGINGIPSNLKFIKHRSARSSKVMVGPFSPTHQEREELLKIAKFETKVFDIIKTSLSPGKFALVMNDYNYVACPRGNGVDTHRFWEALYRGCIPIVIASNWSASIRYLDLPFIEVADWSDVDDAIHSFISRNTPRLPSDIESLWMPYWNNLLRD